MNASERRPNAGASARISGPVVCSLSAKHFSQVFRLNSSGIMGGEAANSIVTQLQVQR